MVEKKLLVCLVGTDGSGKTTTTDEVCVRLKGQSVERIWLGAESILLWPVRKLLRVFRRSVSSPKGDSASYLEEIKEKNSLVDKYPRLSQLYVWLVLADYKLQYIFKRLVARGTDTLILDRYFFDVAVNLALTLGWNEEQLIEFLSRHFHRFEFPQVRFFVRVPPEISMERKDDIPDSNYISLRLSLYDRIAKEFGFIILDGTASVDQNVGQILQEIERCRKSLHVHYVHSNNYDLGGADFCMLRMAEEIQRLGFDVTASLRLRTSVASGYAEGGLPLFIYPFCRPQLSRGVRGLLFLPFTAVWSLVYFIRLLARLKPDILHVNDLYDFVPAIAGFLLRIPVVYHVRMIRVRRAESLVFGWLMRCTAAASVSVSQAVRSTYFKNFETPRHRARVIYDWPNDLFVAESNGSCPPEFSDTSIRVVMIGRLEEWKGQHVFVEAVAQLSKSEREDVGFYLIGGSVTGEEKEKYAQKVLAAASEAGIKWLGERRDIRNILEWADVSVHASTTPDPFPGVVLESLLAQSAVIGARAGGVAEMIENYVHGLLVSPGDVQGLTEALRKVLSSVELRETFGKKGRARILEMCRKEDILSTLSNLYRELRD